MSDKGRETIAPLGYREGMELPSSHTHHPCAMSWHFSHLYCPLPDIKYYQRHCKKSKNNKKNFSFFFLCPGPCACYTSSLPLSCTPALKIFFKLGKRYSRRKKCYCFFLRRQSWREPVKACLLRSWCFSKMAPQKDWGVLLIIKVVPMGQRHQGMRTRASLRRRST